MIPKRKYAAPSEAHIQETCSQFLELDGWRRVRTDLKQLRGMGVQEPGMADDLYIRYPYSYLSKPLSVKGDLIQRSNALVLWIEWKSKTGKGALHQKAWHARERAAGALTLIAGEDFAASIESFRDWYFKSGLRRRVL